MEQYIKDECYVVLKFLAGEDLREVASAILLYDLINELKSICTSIKDLDSSFEAYSQ